MKYRIDPKLFLDVPDFCRGVIIAENCDNTAMGGPLEDDLKSRISAIARDEGLTLEDSRIQAWTALYRKFPSPKGERIRPSVASLIRRIKRGDGDRLPFISPLVAISNLISLTYVVPSGLVDPHRVAGDLVLGFGAGDETFLAFGRDEVATVEPGEVIYFDSATRVVMCRAWNSRGGQSTGIRADTKAAVIDVDALLSVVPRETLVDATEFAASLVERHCSAKTRVFYLDRETTDFEF